VPDLRRKLAFYACEGACLGAFMLSAIAFNALLGHPGSPVRAAVPGELARRFLMGLAMGGTLLAIVYSPLGRRSGAHMNPALTLTFWRLGKVRTPDALLYALAQFLGGAGGAALAALLLRPWLADPAVGYATTVPGPAGLVWAFVAEVGITFLLVSVVLRVSNGPHARLTGLCAAALVCLYITFEAPLSGMSMNPARTLASALPAGDYHALWVYFVAPPLGMLGAAEAYVRLRPGGLRAVLCAKLHHDHRYPCPFNCGYCRHEPAPAPAASHPAPPRASRAA
jgi:aquaporin Z